LLIYAYAVGQTSSRGIERCCEHDVAFRVITANQVPDHDTIAAFRVRHRAVFTDLFVQVLRVCRAAGMVRVGTIAVDGTKLAANASSRANRTAAGIDRSLAELTGAVEQRVAAADTLDAAEDAEHGDRRGDEPPEDMKDPSRRRELLARARAELEAAERAAAAEQAAREARYEQRVAAREAHRQAHGSYPRGRPPTKPAAAGKPLRVNTTDPDSRPQRTAQRFLQGYNAQAVVSDDQIVIAAELAGQANDAGQLAPMTATALQNLSRAGIHDPVATVLADTGYFTAPDITALNAAHHHGRGPQPLVPPSRDALRDPEVQQPPTRESAVRRQMRERLAEPEHRERYRRRGVTVEPVFGQIKSRISSRFRVRGREHVRAELALIATAHNLLKLHTATP
jgi:hypothetical protein